MSTIIDLEGKPLLPGEEQATSSAPRNWWKPVAVATSVALALSGAVVGSSLHAAGGAATTKLAGTDMAGEVAMKKIVYGDMSPDDVKSLFHKFQSNFGRAYEDEAEEDFRFMVFKKNLMFIDALNKQHAYALFSVTQFADYTEDERGTMRLSEEYASWDKMKARMPDHVVEAAAQGPDGVLTRDETTGTLVGMEWMQSGQVSWSSPDDCAACKMYPGFEDYSYDSMPTDFDWRALGAVTAVKNQKYCGSCWTFSTAADLEGTRYLATGTLESLSEQQLVACDTLNYGCDGGYPFAAMQYIESFGGLVSDESYPYRGICAWDACGQDIYYGTPTCDTDTLNDELRNGSVAHIGGWQVVAMGADYEDLMAITLLKNGPISIAFNANGMDYYVHGVMGCSSESYCEAGGIDEHSPCDPTYLDHAVLIVGYGTQDDVDYWVIKNSWGTEWGEEGYYRIVKGENHCGVANFAVHSVVKGA